MKWTYGLILSVLIPQFKSIKEIRFTEIIDVHIENELFPRDAVVPCDDEDTVNWSNLGLSKIPIHVIERNEIRHVDLSFNSIEKIPNTFFRHVPNLKCLNLTSNGYPPRKTLDNSYSFSLKTLILDRSKDDEQDQYNQHGYNSTNRNKSNPCEMTGYFPNLKTLHINGIKGCSIDDVSFKAKLPRLSTLYAMDYGNNIVTYDWSLPDTLRHLHLERTEFRESFFDKFDKLQTLYLDGYNYITDFNIPYDATNLRVLSCRNCSLTRDEINKFFSVPRHALRRLDLSDNILQSLPDNMAEQAKNLEILLLSYNYFMQPPDVRTLGRLRGLMLNHNRIYKLADVASDSLKMLSLRANRIKSIYATTFQRLPALEVLDLSENRLTTLPTGWAHNLKKMVRLNLKSNLFATISDTSLTTPTGKITHLIMNGNPIKRLVELDFRLVPDTYTIYLTLGCKTSVQHKPRNVTFYPETRYRVLN